MPEKDHPDTPAVQGNTYESPIGNFRTFMDCKPSRDFMAPDVDVVISGVPFDLTTTGRPGARLGPAKIRQVSEHLAWEIYRWPWNFHVFDIIGVVDCGDLCFEPVEKDQMMSRLQHHAAQILAAHKIMLTFGGDHFITLPLLREHTKKYGPLALIHFDAHTDTERKQDQYNHGTIFFHAVNEGIVIPDQSVQIGIRTEYIRADHRFTVLDAAWVMDHSADAVLTELRRVVGDHPVYVTFDIDCLDPAFAPGTGTPVVGGLTTDFVLKIIRGLVGCNLIGMDIVEVSPPYDHAELTALAAATISLEILYVFAANRKMKLKKA
ncbi:MAG: agmatinase [Deltaproteobacteria bacterium]|nr:MAG: agmatinase [Deltaproteobacteria bacterium]